jgi:hypothetical protein
LVVGHPDPIYASVPPSGLLRVFDIARRKSRPSPTAAPLLFGNRYAQADRPRPNQPAKHSHLSQIRSWATANWIRTLVDHFAARGRMLEPPFSVLQVGLGRLVLCIQHGACYTQNTLEVHLSLYHKMRDKPNKIYQSPLETNTVRTASSRSLDCNRTQLASTKNQQVILSQTISILSSISC